MFLEFDFFEGCPQEERTEVGRSTEQCTLQIVKIYRELSSTPPFIPVSFQRVASVGSLLQAQKIRIPRRHQMGHKMQVKLLKALSNTGNFFPAPCYRERLLYVAISLLYPDFTKYEGS